MATPLTVDEMRAKYKMHDGDTGSAQARRDAPSYPRAACRRPARPPAAAAAAAARPPARPSARRPPARAPAPAVSASPRPPLTPRPRLSLTITQVAVLSGAITYMTKHMQENKKDYASLPRAHADGHPPPQAREYLLREDLVSSSGSPPTSASAPASCSRKLSGARGGGCRAVEALAPRPAGPLS